MKSTKIFQTEDSIPWVRHCIDKIVFKMASNRRNSEKCVNRMEEKLIVFTNLINQV